MLVLALVLCTATLAQAEILPFFLCSVDEVDEEAQSLNSQSQWLDGYSHFRLLPGSFPSDMHFHFDGLATLMKFEFTQNTLSYSISRYHSKAANNWNKTNFFGTGTGPTFDGLNPSFLNPAVNLLPIKDQLWLTTDTSFWGRMDPSTLETSKAKTKVFSTVLNAHPACDMGTGECFVQYPCSRTESPYTNQACVGILQPSDLDLHVQEISRVTLPRNFLIQHSHEPCVTPNFVVSKLDRFGNRDHGGATSGMLRILHQVEDNLWLLMDRKTNKSRILTGDLSFVSNHFTNCIELDGKVLLDTVAVTGDYLDNYFEDHLQEDIRQWDDMFMPPQRCSFGFQDVNVSCEPLLAERQDFLFDYPTFNPAYKMDSTSRYYYGIAPLSHQSPWFDSIVKIDFKSRTVAQTWSEPNVYVTEADFIAYPNSEAEDGGVLVSIAYNATSDTSLLIVVDATNLKLLDTYPLSHRIPFHAHGVICTPDKTCFTNP